jgi:endopeptidase La
MSIKKIYIENISKFQIKWKNLLNYRNRIFKEISYFKFIIQNILKRLQISYQSKIVNVEEYKRYMTNISNTIKEILFFPNKISVTFIKNHGEIRMAIKIAKIKVSLISLANLIGSTDIIDLFFLYCRPSSVNEAVGWVHLSNLEKNDDYLNDTYLNYLNFYKRYFNVIKCESYKSDSSNNITFKLVTTYGNEHTNSITLASYQLDKPSVTHYKIFTKNLLLKSMGAKLLLPYKNKLIVLYGYFDNDELNMYRNNNIFKKKYNKLSVLFQNLDVNDNFKKNFINSLSIKNFLLNKPKDICNMCLEEWNYLIKIKNKQISYLVKDFLTADIDIQKKMLTVLLINNENSDCSYLAHLLFDLLKSDSQIPLPKNADIIYDSFHWKLKEIFKDTKETVENINTKLFNIQEDIIPYEKRIHLLKSSEIVKSKALDKLKEINNSKNGENNAKAQQYLDGLLKVPFGIYKKESIKHKLNELENKFNKIIHTINRELISVEENNTLSDISLTNTANLQIIINSLLYFNPINLSKFINDVKSWMKKNISNTIQLKNIYNINKVEIYFKKKKVNELKQIINELMFTFNGKKNDLINQIINYNYQSDGIHIIKKYIPKDYKNFTLFFETEEYITIISSLEQINNLWIKYLDNQSKYFKNVSKNLDKAIYGLDDAKNQIKRVLAQWINGTDKGYVFGFEGPAGTGKTTLAKKGIANCLKDPNGKPRPFVFIALGGSSNGSTLEGHNYTYVGSTWGRILDGIMDSKCMNPIIYIDELDKISRTEHGREIVGILTHLTDPSQNTEFTDKYFSGIKFDISKCLIIFSYNDVSLIDKILLDRIQRIVITPIKKRDKIMICKKHVIPEIISNIGFNNTDIELSDDILIYIMDTFTYEAGVRKLKEKLYELYREINLRYLLDGEKILPFKINKKFIDKVFQNYDKVDITYIHDKPRIGLVNGLYATSSGIGGITVIEAFKFYSNTHLELKLTGMQGDVMKESMCVAKTLALNLIPQKYLDEIKNEKNKFGIHIHCPAGATPKDGPSAGTAITVAIVSLLTRIPVRNDIGLTGEINLNGDVLKIGGLESKLDGAKKANVKKVLYPLSNHSDFEKIIEKNNSLLNNFNSSPIKNIYNALDELLLIPGNKKANNFFNKI